LLRALLALSLVYFVALLLDLVLHPLGPGIGVSGFGVGEATAERYIAVLIGAGTIVVGAFIMRRVPGNWIGPLMIVWGAGYTGYETLVDYGSPFLTSLTHVIFGIFSTVLAFSALIVLLLIFPTGQVYPRRAVPWLALYIVLNVIGGALSFMAQSPSTSVSSLGQVSLPMNPFFVPALAPYYMLINGATSNILSGLGLVAAAVSLILRYRAAQSRERQQIKWFVWITCLIVILATIDFAMPSSNTLLASPLVIGYLMFFYALLGAAPAIAIGLAILRHRLWDIDIIINRTLVYGSLTALLALLYFGLIVGLQALFQGMFHQNNAVAIVVSTLVIAALFQPLRRRIQRIIDRRFYRRKYDAARTLAQFSVTLRSEVDLSQLSKHLLVVVQETMQPAHVSLWLRKSGGESKPGSTFWVSPSTGTTSPLTVAAALEESKSTIAALASPSAHERE
jgi:hypothetical protein